MSYLEIDDLDSVLDYLKFFKNLTNVETVLKKLYAIKTIYEIKPNLIGNLDKTYDINNINNIIKEVVKKYGVSLKIHTWKPFYSFEDNKLITMANTNITLSEEYIKYKFSGEFKNLSLLGNHYSYDKNENTIGDDMLYDISFFNPNAPEGLSPPGRYTAGRRKKGRKSIKKKSINRKKKSINRKSIIKKKY